MFPRIFRFVLLASVLSAGVARHLAADVEPAALSSATPVAASPIDLNAVCAKLRAVKWVQADFTEEKTLHILTHPLRSKGTLLFSPQKGVYRVTTEPVHQELLITRAQLIQKDAQGSVQRMHVRGQPAARVVVDIFLSFFSGDSNAWEKAFDATVSGEMGRWEIKFTPKRKSPAAKALRRIVLQGHDEYLDTVTLDEANGDETRTTYLNQRVSHDEKDAAASQFPDDLKPS